MNDERNVNTDNGINKKLADAKGKANDSIDKINRLMGQIDDVDEGVKVDADQAEFNYERSEARMNKAIEREIKRAEDKVSNQETLVDKVSNQDDHEEHGDQGNLYIPFNYKEGDPPTYYKTEAELQLLQAKDMQHFITNAPRIYKVVRELLENERSLKETDNEENNGSKDKPLSGNADTSDTSSASTEKPSSTTDVDTNTNT